MVGMRKSGGLRPEYESPVKLEIVDDDLEEEHGPLNKRSMLFSSGTSSSSMAPANYNPLDEPSSLGLNHIGDPKGLTAAASGNIEKLKASNFPASLLKIGNWEYKSKYENDLVAKCYFAKQKLVWEVLQEGLKSKIEFQWSDIVALNANSPEGGPETLTLVLARQPSFSREIDPQPRKHTQWQATSDFTGGQASMYRQHFLQCNEGLLYKHFEKLVQCDHRLLRLSQQPEIALDSPYFDPRQSIFENPSEPEGHPFGNLNFSAGPSISGIHNLASPVAAQSSSEICISLLKTEMKKLKMMNMVLVGAVGVLALFVVYFRV